MTVARSQRIPEYTPHPKAFAGIEFR